MINVCIAGATGWTGTPLARAVLAAEDLTLVSAVSRSAAGKDLGAAWGQEPLGVPVFATVDEAMKGVDVLVDYTSHETVRVNTLTALSAGVGVVIGSSGLTGADFDDIEAAATANGVGVVAAAISRSPQRWPRPHLSSPRDTSRSGRSSTTRRQPSPTLQAALHARWPND